MKNIEEKRERYLRDPLAVRIGGLAANFARMSSFVSFPQGKTAVCGLLNESKCFIEWSASDYDPHTAMEMVDLQRRLIRWERSIDQLWDEESERLAMGAAAKRISEELLARSGLLDQ